MARDKLALKGIAKSVPVHVMRVGGKKFIRPARTVRDKLITANFKNHFKINVGQADVSTFGGPGFSRPTKDRSITANSTYLAAEDPALRDRFTGMDQSCFDLVLVVLHYFLQLEAILSNFRSIQIHQIYELLRQFRAG